MNDADRGEEMLDEDDEERVERTRNVRRKRRGRERDSQLTPQAKQEEQEAQEKQENQEQKEDVQTETPQAKQAKVVEQPTVAELEPVTQREHDTYYLNQNLREELERVYRRMSLDMLEAADVDLDDQRIGGRNRYFRPLALLLGAREIADMSPEELREALEEEELIDDLPDPE